MLRVALPNKGALSDGAIELVQKAGYSVRKGAKVIAAAFCPYSQESECILALQDLHCVDQANNIEFYFLRPTDIPTYVASGIFHFGITGRDITANFEAHTGSSVGADPGAVELIALLHREQAP
jgi:ATP phosphoribosyltransferase